MMKYDPFLWVVFCLRIAYDSLRSSHGRATSTSPPNFSSVAESCCFTASGSAASLAESSMNIDSYSSTGIVSSDRGGYRGPDPSGPTPPNVGGEQPRVAANPLGSPLT